jgi:hypothetical protein
MSHSNQCNNRKLFEKCIYVCSVNLGIISYVFEGLGKVIISFYIYIQWNSNV